MSLQEAKQFVAHFIKGEYSPEEYEAFLQWLRGAAINDLNEIADEHEALHDHWSLPSGSPSPEWMEQLERKLDGAKEEGPEEEDGKGDSEEVRREVPVIGIRTMWFTRRKTWIAAASVIILLSVGTYLYVGQQESKAGGANTGIEALTNTFSNPRGGEQKQLILDDGSKVWLNAASTLKYPARFTGPQRLVELSGEAFFEVKKNSGYPFRVLIKDAEVEVLGTDFNIEAYDDEPNSRTTLIEGAVKIERGSENVTLRPGQQAVIPYPSSGVVAPVKVLSGIDPEAALAWKKGYFQFENDDLHTVMRALARCYNVLVQYDPGVPETAGKLKITGIFARKDGLTKILEQLASLNIHFKNDGKTVTVSI